MRRWRGGRRGAGGGSSGLARGGNGPRPGGSPGRRLRLLTRVIAMVAAILVAASGLPFLNGVAFAQTPPLGPLTALSGTVTVVWGDPQPGTGGQAKQLAFLNDSRGQKSELEIDSAVAQKAGGLEAINRRPVNLLGRTTSASTIRVESIELDGRRISPADIAASAVTGNQRFVTILCRFGDATSVTPRDSAYVTGLVTGATRPQINHFWREQSFGQINLDGSAVVGWFNLPQPRSYYIPNGSLSFSRASQDCTAQANASVNFSQYVGINLLFNQDLDGSAWGGTESLTLDGSSKLWPITWMPPWGYNNQGVLAHEMGHAFGLPHSSGQYGLGTTPRESRFIYDSHWDVMSAAGQFGTADTTYGEVGTGTISYHKDMLGWIPANRRYDAPENSTLTITLDSLAQVPATTGTYLMAKIPIAGSTTRFYTVEARKHAGYDIKVPGEGVVIHSVDSSRREDAHVVDSDNDGDTNDAGAIWSPGETFTDTANSISVQVVAATASGWQVTINRGTLTQGSANDGFPGATVGTGSQTANTAAATTQSGEPVSFTCTTTSTITVGKTVWYSYTPGSSGTVTVSTAGSTFDTVLRVYTGSAVNGLTALTGGCNDDVDSTLQSRVSFAATGGTTYRIQAAGYSGDSGSLALAISGSAAPADPRQEGPVQIGGDLRVGGRATFTIAVKNYGGSATPALHPYIEGTNTANVFWRADGSQPASAVIQPGQTQSFTVYQDLASAGIWTSNGVFLWDNSASTYWKPLPANGQNQQFTFQVTIPGPPNDGFGSPVAITSLPANFTVETATATTETGEPTALTGCTNGQSTTQIGKTVWYRFAPSAAVSVVVSTAGSTFDTALAVHTGSAVGSLTKIACDDDGVSSGGPSRLAFNANGGTVYYIQAGGWSGASGSLVLNVTPGAPVQVQSVNATPVSRTAIKVQWEYTGPPVTAFRVKQWTGSQWVQLTQTAANARAWEHTGLQEGTTYRYTVDAVNGSGEVPGCPATTCITADATTYKPTGDAGVNVSRPPSNPPSGGPALTVQLAARPGCGAIERIQFGLAGSQFDNASVTIVTPAGGSSAQTGFFVYTPPAGVSSVSLSIQRVVQRGAATVTPISLYDGCGEWKTFVGGGPSAFN